MYNKNKQNLEMVQKKQSKVSKLAVATALLGLGSSLFATSSSAAGVDENEAFGQLFIKLEEWLTGNLGKLLALFGFIGTFIIYLMTHKGSVLFIGVIISLIAGGLVGITLTFFDVGTTSFQYVAPTP